MANVPALGRFDQRSVPRVVLRNTCAEEARSRSTLIRPARRAPQSPSDKNAGLGQLVHRFLLKGHLHYHSRK